MIYAPRHLTYGVSGFTAEAWVFYQGTSITGSPMLKPDTAALVSRGRY